MPWWAWLAIVEIVLMVLGWMFLHGSTINAKKFYKDHGLPYD